MDRPHEGQVKDGWTMLTLLEDEFRFRCGTLVRRPARFVLAVMFTPVTVNTWSTPNIWVQHSVRDIWHLDLAVLQEDSFDTSS